MDVLRKIYSVLDKWVIVNIGILAVMFFPVIVIYLMFKALIGFFHKKNEMAKSEKEMLLERIECGEVKIADLPHVHLEEDSIFPFVNNEEPRFKRTELVYVTNGDGEFMRHFLNEEKDWVAAWTAKYGFTIVIPRNQDKVLNDLLFPQDKLLLTNGFLHDLNSWSADREYGVTVSQFEYYGMKGNTQEDAKVCLQNIVLQLYAAAGYGVTQECPRP